jgi:hypothetical protein
MTKEALLFYGYNIDNRCYMFHRNLAELVIRYRDHTNVLPSDHDTENCSPVLE